MQKIRFLFGILFILFLTPLQAEIQSVIVRWNPAYCSTGCAANLQAQFSHIFSASQVDLNIEAGQAVIYWKPYAVFTYQQIAWAMNTAGNREYEIRLRVRGTITHDRSNFYLTSLGDNTTFTLMAPAMQTVTQPGMPYYTQRSPYSNYYSQSNPYSSPYSTYYSQSSPYSTYYSQSSPYSTYYNNMSYQPGVQDLRNQLLLGEQSGQLMLVEGSLFEPWRYVNMSLVIEGIQFVH